MPKKKESKESLNAVLEDCADLKYLVVNTRKPKDEIEKIDMEVNNKATMIHKIEYNKLIALVVIFYYFKPTIEMMGKLVSFAVAKFLGLI